MIRRMVVVHGTVQGVGFRYSCRREAMRRGVAGSVTNRPDGTVEAHFEGPADAVEAMVSWARRGPSQSVVERIEAYDEEPVGDTSFGIR